MQAIILAAGMGRRLGALTADNTKCMVEVNGQCLIDRMLNQLAAMRLSRIVIITGYEGDKLRRHVQAYHGELNVVFIDNPVYERTNNIYSLWLAREYMVEDDTLLLESDIIFDGEILRMACNSPEPDIVLVDRYQPWMDGTMVQIDAQSHRILNFIPKKAFRYADADTYYKTVNIYKISRRFAADHYLPFLDAYIKVMGHNEYYEQVLRVITLIDTCPLVALSVEGHRWYEIDDVQDLRIAELLFSSAPERLSKLYASYGGYWRYPGLTDFCYLVNPYFPTPRMTDEIKASFDPLMRQYPSGSAVNRMLAGKCFGVKEEYTAVGNGAAELIKALIEVTRATNPGKTGVILPSFEEYFNRMTDEEVVVYEPDFDDFRYTASELMYYFGNRGLKRLLVVNPDNPSGNQILLSDMIDLCIWTKKKGIQLIVDESFVDFAYGPLEENTLLTNELLEQFPNLVIIKSISKSFGVPGFRLGIVASSDTELIAAIQRHCSIWNINSYGEFFLQIYGKYDADYKAACEEIKRAREKFFIDIVELHLDYIRPIQSQANYFLCEVSQPYTAHDLCVALLDRYGILIKDCTGKRGFHNGRQYVRIAVRDDADNLRLVKALAELNPD